MRPFLLTQFYLFLLLLFSVALWGGAKLSESCAVLMLSESCVSSRLSLPLPKKSPSFTEFREDPRFPASGTTGLGTAQIYPRCGSSCGSITNDTVLHFGQALCLAWARGSLWGVFGVMLSAVGLSWRVSGRDTLLTRRDAGSAWFVSANKINHTTQSCII